MLNKYARAFFTRVLTPFAAFLLRLGVSPDAVTLIGTAGVMAGALVFYPRGEFFWGTSSSRCSSSPTWSTATWRGRRASPAAGAPSWTPPSTGSPTAAIFGGLALWYAGSGDDNVLCAVAIFCLASGQVVSYTKARGEAIGLPVDVNGLVERAERLVITLVAGGLAGLHAFGVPGIEILLPIALWIVAVGSLVTLVQRVVTVRRESAEADAAAGREQRERARSAAAMQGAADRRAVRAGLERGQEAARAGGRARSAAPSPTPRGSGAARACCGWRPTSPGSCPDAGPRAARRAVPGRHALVHALLDGVLPAARLERGARHAAASTSRTCTT